MYTITTDASQRILTAELSGFFSLDEVAAFARDEQAAARALRRPSESFGLVLNAPDGIAQGQDVITAFAGLMRDMPLKAGRIAFASKSALLRLQVRRIIPAERAAVFEDVADATEWVRAELDGQSA